MKKFEQIQVGDKAQIKHTITQQDIEKFVELTGDDNKLHIDKVYAAKTSFKKPVAHGMLGASFISTIIGTKIPGDGALWFSQSLEFLLPVRVGDELTIEAEVTKKLDKLQTIELQTNIYNQDKQKVTSGVAKVKIVEQEDSITNVVTPPKPRKTALVIGGTGGIGQATCSELAQQGYELVIHYFSNQNAALALQEKLKSLGIKVHLYKADITNEKEVNELMEFVQRKFDVLTAVVHCATVKIPAIKLDKLAWEDLQKHIDINIKSNFLLAKHYIPHMEQQKYGKVVLLTTQAIESMPPTDWLPYVTAKSALFGFGKALAVEVAPKGIRINFVSPSMTETELIADIPEKVRLVTAAKTPLRRLATATEVAQSIAFLVSEQSDFMTGETLRINGGQIMF